MANEARRNHLRNRYLLLVDAVLLFAAPYFLYALRFESWSIEPAHGTTALWYAVLSLPCRLVVLWAFGLYRRLWRYASVGEMRVIFVGAGSAALVNIILGAILLPRFGITPRPVPLSVLFTDGLLMVAIVALPRLRIRTAGLRSSPGGSRSDARRVLIAGAGMAGERVVRELRHFSDLHLEPIGFVDDDWTKHGMKLADLPVLGSLRDIPELVGRHEIHEVLIAMPRASGSVIRSVVRSAYEAGVRTRTVPGLSDLISERVSVTAIREVQIEDLLRRDPIQTDLAAVSTLITGRTVLVTGAGGSIGSELCRQVIALAPSKLVLLGNGENPIFDIENQLRALASPGVEVVAEIADIRARERIRSVFRVHQPFTVFHAAAHKHVPLMEQNVCEAITNNVMGTRNLVQAAAEFDAEHFVLISTDKAVRPTSVMGASKRVAEYVVHNAGVRYNKNFVAVRFGNVLGSQGSVVPTFLRQIRAGGPVTVTHPEMRRYFMTIPEAVQLVLQAGAIGRGGELFMLDMGEPLKIVDLARDMIRLSGLEENADIEIRFTGVREGEKLYEEMFFSHEIAEPTAHPKILRSRPGVEYYAADERIEKLVAAAVTDSSPSLLRQLLKSLVPDFSQSIPTDAVTEPFNVSATDLRAASGEPTPPRTSGSFQRVSKDGFPPQRRNSGSMPVISG